MNFQAGGGDFVAEDVKGAIGNVVDVAFGIARNFDHAGFKVFPTKLAGRFDLGVDVAGGVESALQIARGGMAGAEPSRIAELGVKESGEALGGQGFVAEAMSVIIQVALGVLVWGGLFAFESMIAMTGSVSSSAKISHSGSVLTSSR